MQYEKWDEFYELILREFGFDAEADEQAARILDKFLHARQPFPLDALRASIAGKSVTVLGASHGAARAVERGLERPVVVCDKAAGLALSAGLAADLLVTDLDGDVEAQMHLNERGTPVAVHAHGDNMAALRMRLHRFPGPVLGTCQVMPFGRLANFGGFTDGDRACFLAEELGAKEILLAGF
ncbi:MAG: 6-hydroxymethylpterin diphosphokinase MptE-like protein, partial [Methanobacteriota archaeon]